MEYTSNVISAYLEAYKQDSRIKYVGTSKTKEVNGQRSDIIFIGNDFGVNAMLIGRGRELVARCYTFYRDDCVWISAIQVAKNSVNNFRDMGIGSAVIGFVEDIAKEKGCTKIALDSTRSAYPFYQKVGFTELDIPKNKTCAIKTMAKTISSEYSYNTSNFEVSPNYHKKSCPSVFKDPNVQI